MMLNLMPKGPDSLRSSLSMQSQPTVRPTVVSLLSSATETIYELGLEVHLVGRSHECDYPPACSALPQCSLAQVNHLQASSCIDRQVKELSESGATMYTLDGDTVARLAPDVIAVQGSCRICAVSPGALTNTALDCKTLVLRPRTLPDVLADVVW